MSGRARSTMLVADDEPGMRDLFRYCFEPARYDIDTAVDRQTAVEAVRQWRYRPALCNGEPRKVETEVLVEFRR